ncbi:MAG: hypothetical protein GKR89_25995 [Candidatus Latescibacteria bacterium]|nr:hypothetical protein [Candidatus Latescibacterota bacterium]
MPLLLFSLFCSLSTGCTYQNSPNAPAQERLLGWWRTGLQLEESPAVFVLHFAQDGIVSTGHIELQPPHTLIAGPRARWILDNLRVFWEFSEEPFGPAALLLGNGKHLLLVGTDSLVVQDSDRRIIDQAFTPCPQATRAQDCLN